MKIIHHNEDLSGNSHEGIKRNLEIPALQLGHLTEHQRKVARVSTDTVECLHLSVSLAKQEETE